MALSIVEQLRREFYAGLLTLDESAEALGIGRKALAKLIKDGQLRTVRVGLTVYIGEGTLRSYIAAAHGTAIPAQQQHCPAPAPHHGQLVSADPE